MTTNLDQCDVLAAIIAGEGAMCGWPQAQIAEDCCYRAMDRIRAAKVYKAASAILICFAVVR